MNIFKWFKCAKHPPETPLKTRVLFQLQDGNPKTAMELAAIAHASPQDINIPLEELVVEGRIMWELIGEYPLTHTVYRIVGKDH